MSLIDLIANLRRIQNQAAAETFDQTTDSLEAISNAIAAMGFGPGVSLWMFGRCAAAMAPSTTVITTDNLGAVLPNDVFDNHFWMQVIRNVSAPVTAPEGEIRRITGFVGATQTFTTDGFTANLEPGDLVAIFHESILPIEILGFGTLTTSSATVPADVARTEANNYFRGHLLMTTEGAVRFRPTRIVEYTGAGGIFIVDPNNPFPAATGLVDYVICGSQAEFVPAGGGTNNRTPADVIGMKDEVVPAMNIAPATVMTDTIVHHVKAILERVGATPADPDDSLLTNIGQRDDVATLDTLADITTTSIQAKLRRILTRMAPGAFSATIQGAARTDLALMLDQLATYIAALGAAYSATVDPGGAARTNIEQTLEDLGAILAGAAGLTTFPVRALPANTVSMAEVERYIAEVKPEFAATTAASHVTASAVEETILTTAYTVPFQFFFDLDLVNLVAGDDFTFRFYKRIDGATYRLMSEQQIVGAPTLKVYSILDEYGDSAQQVRVTVQRNGATNRTFPYRYNSLRQPVA